MSYSGVSGYATGREKPGGLTVQQRQMRKACTGAAIMTVFEFVSKDTRRVSRQYVLTTVD